LVEKEDYRPPRLNSLKKQPEVEVEMSNSYRSSMMKTDSFDDSPLDKDKKGTRNEESF
jgi:hypothetical protein